MSARWKGPSRDHRAAADSGAEAIRFSTPMTDAPNTRRKAGENERSGASRQKTGGFAGTDSGDPRPRGGPLHRSAAKRFSLWTAQSRSRRRLRRLTDAAYPLRVRPVFFSTRRKRQWGVEWASRQRGWIPASNGTHPVGGRLPPLRRHRDVPINIPDGSAVPRGVCCSPGYGHSRPPRRSPSERGHASGSCR